MYKTSSFASHDLCSLYLGCHLYCPLSISNFIFQGPGQMSLPLGGRWYLQVKLIASSSRVSRDFSMLLRALRKVLNLFPAHLLYQTMSTWRTGAPCVYFSIPRTIRVPSAEQTLGSDWEINIWMNKRGRENKKRGKVRTWGNTSHLEIFLLSILHVWLYQPSKEVFRAL